MYPLGKNISNQWPVRNLDYSLQLKYRVEQLHFHIKKNQCDYKFMRSSYRIENTFTPKIVSSAMEEKARVMDAKAKMFQRK